MEETVPYDGQLPLHGVGDRLRMAREAAGMTLAQLAAETRIPERHLGLIERGDFAALPARTYATGFARTYAKAVGLDDRAVVEDVRAELADGHHASRHRAETFEPGDPARIPTRGLALASLAALAILVAGGAVFYQRILAPGSGPPSLLEEQRMADRAAARQRAAAPDRAIAPVTGPVVFTALEEGVWVKFSDGEGAQIFQKEMAKGERFTLPPDAGGATLWTGRPDALSITIGGKPVPRIAEREGIVKNVPVTAEALLARGQDRQAGAVAGTIASAGSAPAATPPDRRTPAATAAARPARRTPVRPAPVPSATPAATATVSQPVIQPVPGSPAEPQD